MRRQNDHLEMIASENFVSAAVLEAQGSVLTNKYAEGYPGPRYYGGCEFVDVAEQLAIDRAKALFGADHANVQPHSGSQANQAVYFAALKPGDTVLGMSLTHGGHLTHGSPVNLSGQVVPASSHYGVDRETERIDYDEVRRLALEERPKLIVAGGSAYPRIIDFEAVAGIADEVGRHAHGGHGPHRGPGGRGHPPQPGPPRRLRDDHDPQDAAGPPGRHDPCRAEYARDDRPGRFSRGSRAGR